MNFCVFVVVTLSLAVTISESVRIFASEKRRNDHSFADQMLSVQFGQTGGSRDVS